MESIPQFLCHFTSVFTRPAFAHFKRLIEGFLEVHGPSAVTQLNRHKPPTEHFSTIYDFFNRSAWHTLTLAKALLAWLLTEVQPGKRVILAIDDTKAFKPHGPCIEGVCWHPNIRNDSSFCRFGQINRPPGQCLAGIIV